MLVVLVGLSQTFRSTDLPLSQNPHFSGSGNCASCHSPGRSDTALRNAAGDDVSPPTFWRSTMMANAAKDPFWQAKVSAEVAANPGLRDAIEDQCTTCHAPMGRTEALLNGAAGYSLEEMRQDPLAMDGVSCTVCHQIQPANLGTEDSFSGGFEILDGKTVFGPFEDPLGWPMLALSGYDPKHSPHMGESELCASCHTLFTASVDEQGNTTGSLPEQTPYLEWLNSEFPASDVQCQSCHMPIEPGEITISNTPKTLDARSPFYRHEFVGGNAFMLGMLRDNAADLGVTAEPAHFDSTIARTRRMLGSASARLDVRTRWDGDTLDVTVRIENLTGHKLPTGYPSRRMWIDLAVIQEGKTLFRSGGWDSATGEVAGLDAGYEPHHQTIRSEDEVQIYQAVMGNPAGDPTFGLLRATSYLKDNRILPKGWTPDGPWSDVTTPAGLAARDTDFGSAIGAEGGSDRVVYRMALPDGRYQIDVRLRYQTIAPRFAGALLEYSTEEVQRFRDLYNQRDLNPEIMDSVSVEVGLASAATPYPGVPTASPALSVFPNPASVSVTILASERAPIMVYDISGRLIRELSPETSRWDLRYRGGRRVPAGVYFLISTHPDGTSVVPITVLQ
jgi:cytochrome c554/c'-like protein